MNKRISGIACIAVWLCCLMQGCIGDKKEFPVTETIYLNYSKLNLYYGDEVKLTISPGSGVYVWVSDDNAIATVSQSGELKATGKGSTYITVTNANGVKKEIPVVVTVPSADKVTGRPGAYRVAIELDIRSTLIKEVRVTRTDTNESQTADIDFQAGITTVYYSGLDEGSYPFSVVCIDKFGMESDPVELNVSVYGAIYESTVKGRSYGKEHLHAFGNGLFINWQDSGTGDAVEFTYIDRTGTEVTQLVESHNSYTILYNYATHPLTALSYVTIMRPSGSIDDFRSKPTVIPVADIKDEVFILTAAGVTKKGAAITYLGCLYFDIGGEGVAFHDNTTTDGNKQYPRRKLFGDNMSDVVDYEGGGSDGTGSDANLGYNDNGEWHAFTVYVEDAGTYAIDPLVGLNDASTKGVISVDGQERAFNMTGWGGGWGNYKYYFAEQGGWANVPTFTLTRGFHRIVYRWASGGYNYRGIKVSYQP